eukprot:7409217-Lingulodinium_polyedra.AAC.1
MHRARLHECHALDFSNVGSCLLNVDISSSTQAAPKQHPSSAQAAPKQHARITKAPPKQHRSSTQAARKQHLSSTQAGPRTMRGNHGGHMVYA